MAVAKRQGREKPMKIEQTKIKGRSEDQSEDLRQNKQHSWLAQFAQGRLRGRGKHIKRGAKGLSPSFSPVCWGTLFFASLSQHALRPGGWILLPFSK